MKWRMFAFIVVAACSFFTIVNPAAAQVPGLMSYQGRLLSSGTNFNGIGQFKFALVNGGFNNSYGATAHVSSTDGQGRILGIDVDNPGFGLYPSVPSVTITIPPGCSPPNGGASGVTATAVMDINGMGQLVSVQSIQVNNEGTGYFGAGCIAVAIAPPPPNFLYNTYWSNDGSTYGGSEPSNAVPVAVVNGMFMVNLGDTNLLNMTSVLTPQVFSTSDVRLRIWITNGAGGFQQLSPDQRLTTTPYAMISATASNLLGTLPVSQLTGTVPLAQLPSGTLTNGSGGVNLNGSFSGNGGGLTNLPVSSGGFSWQTVSNTAIQAVPNTGYLVTNNALVTVTLPTNANPGDLVRITSAGAGGWKLAQNAGQFVPGYTFYAAPGANWVVRPSGATLSVASSADGTKLVGVAQASAIYTSVDSGATWTARDSIRGWKSVCSSADGTKLAAVVQAGKIYTSTDSGLTWTAHATNLSWFGIASSADGTKLVAVVDGGQIYTSTDSGANWTARASSQDWFGVASSADGTKLVAVVQNGQIYTSTDSGITWTPRTSNQFWYCVASSADGNKLVAGIFGLGGVSGPIYTSTDSGTNWTARDSNRFWYSAASSADGTRLVAGTQGSQIFTSTDSGATWSGHNSNRYWGSAASSADGTKLVAGDINGFFYTSQAAIVAPSTTGASGYLLGGQNTAIELQYLGNGQFQPISYVGSILAF